MKNNFIAMVKKSGLHSSTACSDTAVAGSYSLFESYHLSLF